MSGPASLFREIHRLRRYIRDLQEQLDRIPRQIKARQKRIEERENELRSAQDEIRHLKVEASTKEKTIKGLQEKIARHEEQLPTLKGKAYDAVRVEIAAERTKIGKLEDEALEALTLCDDKALQLPVRQKAVEEAKEDLARFEAQTNPRKADLEAQLRQALKDLEAAETQIPDDLRPQYNRTIASLGADGMAAVKDRNCTACYTEIVAHAQNDLEQEEFVVCSSCGRILYLPESAKADPSADE
jgi:predicted  nucleic acid-binding Zn-ribbon protein